MEFEIIKTKKRRGYFHCNRTRYTGWTTGFARLEDAIADAVAHRPGAAEVTIIETVPDDADVERLCVLRVAEHRVRVLDAK